MKQSSFDPNQRWSRLHNLRLGVGHRGVYNLLTRTHCCKRPRASESRVRPMNVHYHKTSCTGIVHMRGRQPHETSTKSHGSAIFRGNVFYRGMQAAGRISLFRRSPCRIDSSCSRNGMRIRASHRRLIVEFRNPVRNPPDQLYDAPTIFKTIRVGS